jgi:phosphatidylserine/phosphatidylglycerophosphate/cardiolipin synthase-like enzyme
MGTSPEQGEPGNRRGTAGPRTDPEHWFLTPAGRGNPDTTIDSRHPDGGSWTEGNQVTPLVHGSAYFAALLAAVRAMGAGDLLLFTDWRGDPDERLGGPGTEVGPVFAAAAERGVDVRGLVWRSHWDRFRFSAAENRHLGEEIDAAGGQCLLDMRVRPLGSHHQKLVVLRHRDRPQDDVAYIGGIDLCHSRHDDAAHHGDPQPVRMAAVYGPRPPWHDVQLEIRGPAVGDAEAVFRERWDDPSALTLNPLRRLDDPAVARRPVRPLPPQRPDPAPRGSAAVQLLRTYPPRFPRYPFARAGERSVARGYIAALGRARRLVYLEDQYLWSRAVAAAFAAALRRAPELRMVVVVPLYADQGGQAAVAPTELGRMHAMRLLRRAGGDRVAVYAVENEEGTPIYVHAKVCVVDDAWACIGSDNANRRSWTHDSELSAAFVEGTTTGTARSLRLGLAAEHLGAAAPDDVATLDDPQYWFAAYRDAAAALDAWYAGGRRGPRPPGRLRTYRPEPVSWKTRLWAEQLYRGVYDPDGRTPKDRVARRF